MLDYDSKRDEFRKITDEKFIQDSMVKIQAKLDFDAKYTR
jgi:hypothetical protein